MEQHVVVTSPRIIMGWNIFKKRSGLGVVITTDILRNIADKDKYAKFLIFSLYIFNRELYFGIRLFELGGDQL